MKDTKIHIKYKCSECNYEKEKTIPVACNGKFYTFAYICPSTNHDTGIPLKITIELPNNQTDNNSD